MEVLIRQRDARNQLASIDRSISASSIRLGSDPDQDIRLSGVNVRTSHAELKQTRGGIELVCSRDTSVTINDETVSRHLLAAGDVVNIEGNKLVVVAAPAGFDLALDFTPVTMIADTAVSAYKTHLNQSRLSLRKMSWVLAITALLVSMLIPMGYRYLTITDNPAVSYLPFTDSAWSSGPLHATHAALESNCTACHEKLFQKVTNNACEQCHTSTIDHVVAVEQNQHQGLDINGRCASCHKEHNEPISTLVDASNSVCTACHADVDLVSSNRLQAKPLGRVSDFSLASHPPYSAVILQRLDDAPIDSIEAWKSIRVDLPSNKENSQLEFNHEVHLNASKVVDAKSQGLMCSNCHSLDGDGEHFKSQQFELNCANSGCHELALDVQNRLPHGYPDIVVSAMQGYYLRKFGDDNAGEVARATEQPNKRRRFGGSEKEECTDSAYDCALQIADEKIVEQFSKKGCVTCHLIVDTNDANIAERFKVGAVKLTEDYHPSARFDHASHEILVEPGEKNNIQGQDACLYCHNASKSSSSSDILVPELKTCAVCHAGEKLPGTIPLACTQCHSYHPERHSFVDELLGSRSNDVSDVSDESTDMSLNQ